MDTVQVFYNKAIFEKYGIEEPKEGWTWGEMVQTAQALKEKNSDVYPILMELDPQPSYFNFIEQSGGYVLDDTGKKTGLGTPGAIKAYQDVVDLMDQGLMPDNQVLSDTKGTDLFLSQKGAMLFMGSWKCAVLDAASFADQLGTVSMPAREEGNQSVIGGLGYAMNANSKNKEAAWKLIKFLAGEKANRMQAEARIDIPALKSAQQYYKTDHVDSSVIFKAADSGFAYPTSPSVADWNQVITDYSNKIFSKEMTAEEGCEKMGAEVQAILDKE
jgi:multiple sugar transport system substrate-binding protein